jgi:Domain of unknown function (DUF6089)
MRNTTSWLFIAFFCFTSSWAQAQGWELGVGIGALNYKGDLAPIPQINNTRPGLSIQARYNFSPSFVWRNNLTFGGIAGDDEITNDPFQQQRAFSFSGTIGEISTGFEYNFFDWRKDPKNQRFTPYLFGGIGLNTFGVKTKGYPSENDASSFMFVVPFGVGLKQLLNDHWSLSWEFRTGKNFSDRMDSILDDNIGPKQQRVSRLDYDTYYYLGVTASYRFIKLKCPEHFNNRLSR